MRIGIIGGMSAESSLIYYRELNRLWRSRHDGLVSPEIVLHSLNFGPIAAAQAAGQWDDLALQLAASARLLEAAHCDFIALATNTMHKVAAEIVDAIDVPFLSITDALIGVLLDAGIKRPLLLATAFTMEQDFLRAPLHDAGISVMIPDQSQRARCHEIIFTQLCQGIVDPQAQSDLLAMIDRARAQGADAVILGCTELCLAINRDNCQAPLFDTTDIHIRAIVERAHE